MSDNSNITNSFVSSRNEFVMADGDFNFLRNYAFDKVGIVLSDKKRDMLYSRLSRRLRALNLDSFTQYCQFLVDHEQDEAVHFLNAITTNFTSFFRENHHFEFLKSTAIKEMQQRHAQDRSPRIWSAGCSTGEEPYSIAMTLLDGGFDSTWNMKILATDIDTNVLQVGNTGFYDGTKVTRSELQTIQRWSTPQTQSGIKGFMMRPELKSLIAFKRLNLLENWPMKRQYDIIFCRNVVIYFNRKTQTELFARYHDLLVPGGYLIIGHSETLGGIYEGFHSRGGTIYQK